MKLTAMNRTMKPKAGVWLFPFQLLLAVALSSTCPSPPPLVSDASSERLVDSQSGKPEVDVLDQRSKDGAAAHDSSQTAAPDMRTEGAEQPHDARRGDDGRGDGNPDAGALDGATSDASDGSCGGVVLTPSASVVLHPGDDIQAAVNAHPTGTSFLLSAGVYRMQTISPKNGNKFLGERTPDCRRLSFLNGSKLLTRFTKNGNNWLASGQTQRGQVVTVDGWQVCETGYPLCNNPEDLYFDDAPLSRVTSLSALGPGKWYFDYSSNAIYLANDPTGHKVEASVTAYAFHESGSNVAIQGLVIEKYAPPVQHAAVVGGSNWTFELQRRPALPYFSCLYDSGRSGHQ